MLNFEKPEYKITEYVESKNYGKFELEPLERGFGTTLGNALRRIMLSSMQGSAIVAFKMDGVLHEFQTVDGIIEDVTTIVLNLKNIVVKNNTEETKILKLYADKEGVVTAGEIEKDPDIEIINNNSEIFTPTIRPEDDFLKYIVKKAILDKKINLKNYRERFSNDYALNNMKSGLSKSTKMTVPNFIKWCEILGLDWEMTIKDNGDDTINPLSENIYISNKT